MYCVTLTQELWNAGQTGYDWWYNRMVHLVSSPIALAFLAT
jgi:hypothetical protein